MRRAGEVTYSDTHRDRPGEGVVEYATREDMERALDELDDMEIRGRRIRLVRDDQSKGRSKSRSRSRSRSRSPRSVAVFFFSTSWVHWTSFTRDPAAPFHLIFLSNMATPS